MSTDFLNRRMDLRHESEDVPSYSTEFGIVGGGDNYLVMDTSYPVKLAGKVLKLFTATKDFNFNKWILKNTNGDPILTVENSNVYDFAGRVLDSTYVGGIDKVYNNESDVFKIGDYVMVIIDFDNNKMLFCSQSNFTDFITGEDIYKIVSNLKMFVLDGDESIDGLVENPVNTDIFDDAAKYEEGDYTYALVRNDIDKVVYENPKNKDGTRSMTPIANVNTFNINSLNISILNFLYPYINTYSTISGIERISNIMYFYNINGQVNDKFIEEFCFTNDELINLACIINSGGDPYSLLSEYKTIPNDKKDKYYYALMIDTGCIKTSKAETGLRFTPIDKNTYKFSTLYRNSDKPIKVNNSNAMLSLKPACSYLGDWQNSMSNNGFNIWIINGGSKINLYNSNNDLRIFQNIQKSYKLFVNDNRPSVNGNGSDLVFESLINKTTEECGDILKTIYNDGYKYIKFFSNYNDNTYFMYLIKMILGITNTSWDYIYFFLKKDSSSDEPSDKLLKTIILTYPELFENAFENSDESGETIYNFTDFHITDSTLREKYGSILDNVEENRTKYSFYDFEGSVSDGIVQYTVYQLLNSNSTSGFMGLNNVNYLYKINGKISPCKYKCYRSLLDDDGTFNIITTNNKGEYKMLNIITRMYIRSLDKSDDDTKNYNNVDTSKHDTLIVRNIKFANEYIAKYNNNYYYFPNKIPSEAITDDNINNGKLLKIIVKNNDNAIISNLTSTYWKNYTNIGATARNFMLMYYEDGGNVIRIKYYYKNSDDNISKYDYFTMQNISIGDKYSKTDYAVAYKNYIMNEQQTNHEDYESAENNLETELSSTNGQLSVIATVVKAYKIYPFDITAESDINVVGYGTFKYGGKNTIGLTKDWETYDATSINTLSNTDQFPEGFKIKDLLGDNYLIETNAQVPFVSDTKKDNTFVYNLNSYNKYIKTKKVNEVFYTEPFKYINGKGIKECYYKNKTLYEFYNYILTRNLSIPIEEEDSLVSYNTFNNKDITFFNKEEVKKIDHLLYTEEYKWTMLYNSSNALQEIHASLILKSNINPNSIYGFNNNSLLYIESDEVTDKDASEDYTPDDTILINSTKTGNKEVYDISISSGDPMIPEMMSINGNLDVIEADKITWESLLLALNNNKSIDILSDSLTQIKQDINEYIYLEGQNINDMVSLEDNITDAYANSHDTVFDPETDDSAVTTAYKEKYVKDVNAEFDEKHNLYNFNFGYGYKNDEQRLNNRGVIVFVTDGSSRYRNNPRQNGGMENYEYKYIQGKIYPKRMYISKDGLLCTKEYYNNEAATSSEEKTTLKSLQNQINNLKSTIDTLSLKLEDDISALEGSISGSTESEEKMTNFLNMRNSIFDNAMKSMLSIYKNLNISQSILSSTTIDNIYENYRTMNYIYNNIDDYTQALNDLNYELDNWISLHHRQVAKTIKDYSGDQYSKLSEYNDAILDAVNSATTLEDKKSVFVTELKEYLHFINNTFIKDIDNVNITNETINYINKNIDTINFN